MKTFSGKLVGFCCVVLIINACGCGEQTVLVSGRIHYDGKVVKAKEVKGMTVGILAVQFHPMNLEGKTDPYDANLESDGSFTVQGRFGSGIPPGKYKITVEWMDDGFGYKDKLSGAFSDANSQIICEIDGTKEIILNVGNPPTAED